MVRYPRLLGLEYYRLVSLWRAIMVRYAGLLLVWRAVVRYAGLLLYCLRSYQDY